MRTYNRQGYAEAVHALALAKKQLANTEHEWQITRAETADALEGAVLPEVKRAEILWAFQAVSWKLLHAQEAVITCQKAVDDISHGFKPIPTMTTAYARSADFS